MKTERLALALTAANLVLLILVFARVLPTSARVVDAGSIRGTAAPEDSVVPILRGRALELLDDHDQVRVRIRGETDGEVVLRLLDEDGTIRVKLGGESGSGLLLLDEATEPGVHIIARRTGTTATPATTSVTLRGADGRRRVIVP
jgi:hypothetical protein